MPRAKGGIGRTGNKHKKKATHDIHRQLKAEGGEKAPDGPSRAEELLAAAQAAADALVAERLATAAAQLQVFSVAGLGIALANVDAPAEHVSSAEDDDSPDPPVACYNGVRSMMDPWPPEPTPPDHVVKATMRMRGSQLAEEAIRAASLCELMQVWMRKGVDAPLGVIEGWEKYDAEMRERRKKFYERGYHESLSTLKESFPMMVCCEHFERGMCTHGNPCECGKQQAPWPWIVHHPTASRFCECHMYLRREWFMCPDRPYRGAESSADLIARVLAVETSRFRPACAKAGYPGRGCTCNVCYESNVQSESSGSDSEL